MASPEAAFRVSHQIGFGAPPPGSSILYLNPNHPIKTDWADSRVAQDDIENELGRVDDAIEYSIFVHDLAGDVINAHLMGVFRGSNLG